MCQKPVDQQLNAELARDLRLLVRERLAAGDSDAAVLAFVEARYGEFALLRPRMRWRTLLLWLTPLLFLAGAAYALLRHSRRRLSPTGAAPQPTPLSPAEQQRLDALLEAHPTLTHHRILPSQLEPHGAHPARSTRA